MPKPTRSKRAAVFAAWHERCAYCDGPASTLDHVIPAADWGDRAGTVHAWHNLVPACRPCNESKDSKPLAVFLTDDPERLDRIERYLALMTEAVNRRLSADAAKRNAKAFGVPDWSFERV